MHHEVILLVYFQTGSTQVFVITCRLVRPIEHLRDESKTNMEQL